MDERVGGPDPRAEPALRGNGGWSFANVGGYGGPGGGGSGGNIALIGDSITLAETALVEATGGFGGGGPGPG